METSCSYTGKTAYFSSDEPKWKSRIMKLAEQYPGEIEIIARPEDNDGCVYAKIPSSWLKIAPKRSCGMTDEQKSVARERMAKLRAEGRL